ncbi:MAG: C39 family peptidase [Candidatus Levybacteria bacterium]|nr:C39 family peptidase [Candidatus Levybacteria bacterium]
MNKKIRNLIVISAILFIIYTFFWIFLFKTSKPVKKNILTKTASVLSNDFVWPEVENDTRVLSAETRSLITPTVINLPSSYKTDVLPRKQSFNLSCEFAAAASVIYHFSNNPDFSVSKEINAEKILMAKIGASQNPNIGVRMGKSVPDSEDILYRNMNGRFGGTDYYGVHAPPFIDMLKEYKLIAKPLDKSQDLIYQIQKAIYSGHLIMAWTHTGYGQAIDVALYYGSSVPVIRGEHTVVVSGYDGNGVFIMDPASAGKRHISYTDFFEAAKLFPIPFLEVYPSQSFFSFNTTIPIDIPTGLNRNILKIKIENGSSKIGAASEMEEILKDFGYRVIGVGNADCLDCEGIKVRIKSGLTDYKNLLKSDLKLAFYNIDSFLSDIEASESGDVVVTIGK